MTEEEIDSCLSRRRIEQHRSSPSRFAPRFRESFGRGKREPSSRIPLSPSAPANAECNKQ